MKRILIILFSSLVAVTIGVGTLLYINYKYSNVDESDSVEAKIRKTVAVLNGMADKSALSKISTLEFQVYVQERKTHSRRFYMINRDFMKDFREVGSGEAKVTVTVYPFGGHSQYYATFALEKNMNGNYLISSVEFFR